MLKLVKNKSNSLKGSPRRMMIALFGIMVLVGVGVPYFQFGSNGAVAASSVAGTASPSQVAAAGGAVYEYNQISSRDAYPYYIAAAFMIAGGLSMYTLTHVPARVRQRSQYVSRFATASRTTY